MDILSRREETQKTTTWWTYPRVLRRWALALFLTLVAVALLMSVVDLARGGSELVLPALGILLAVTYGAALRERTRVSRGGIEVVSVRTRRMAWQEVAALRLEPPGEWSTKVQAQLADGHLVTLTSVPPEDLDELLRFRPAPPAAGETP